MFIALNKDFSILIKFDRVNLLKSFLFNLKTTVGNSKLFKSQISVIIHCFPELAALSSNVGSFALSDPEVGRYLRSSTMHVNSEAKTFVIK